MTEPEQQAPAVLVENMLLLRKEDFEDLLDRRRPPDFSSGTNSGPADAEA